MIIQKERAFLGIGGVAASAGIASALAGLVIPVVPITIPIIGGLVGLLALKFGDVLDNPDKPIFEGACDEVEKAG